MSVPHFDFVVVGSTPQARLIAGLLAGTHGKTVAFQGESQSGYRLARGVDLSVGVVTRPETWALLAVLVPETIKLIGKLGGRRAWSRIDPILFADGTDGKAALSHVRHMANAFGIAAERVSPRDLGAGRDGIILRDAVLLHRPQLEVALDGWLVQTGATRLDDHALVQINADGSARLPGDPGMSFGQTVLVGDMALERHLDRSGWPSSLMRETCSTILTEPTAPIAAPIMHQLDTRLTLTQPPARGISAMGPGDIDTFTSNLHDLMGAERIVRQAGQASYTRVVSRDGAAVVGRLGGTGPDIVAGFGMSGAFFAPAIARWLCGRAGSAEAAWLGARLCDRDPAASGVAEAGGPQ
jgi:hypothetical protein